MASYSYKPHLSKYKSMVSRENKRIASTIIIVVVLLVSIVVTIQLLFSLI